ncbi:Cyclic pyranopterin phosphate synthase (MoaA), partial [hydrothermal vent metagenome]
LSLSTNAVQLARHAEALKASGVQRLNVSLDTPDPTRFREITGGKLEKVIDGLMAAKAAGFSPIKINMVVMEGINDDDIEAMVDFCIEHDFTLRFIETMPMGDTGRDANAHFIDLKTVRERLERRFELVPGVMPGGGPARYLRVAGTALRLGFITSLSQHFCETCNRVRLSVDGTLYLCLGQEHSVELRPLLRNGIDDDALDNAIRQAITLKPERHEFNDKPGQIVRFMSMTGG